MKTALHGSAIIRLDDFDFALLPGHALWWEAERTLFVTDLHFGKEASFRFHGIPVPDVVSQDLARLDRLIRQTQCEQLVILGDLLHARSGRSSALEEQVARWRDQHDDIDMKLIIGNHDRGAGNPPVSWRITCHEEPYLHRSLQLVHHPQFTESAPTLAGHLHPKFRLQGRGERLNLPGFLLRNQTLVLPAFCSFVDHGLIQPERTDNVFVAADEHVLQIQ